jgi:meiotic recombination protein SPO11
VFRSLSDQHIWKQLPCILVTASGMPDLATRAFLRHLADSFPTQLTFMGLVDWNPSGCHILMNYKFGAAKRSSESVECAAIATSQYYHMYLAEP